MISRILPCALPPQPQQYPDNYGAEYEPSGRILEGIEPERQE